MQPNLGKYIDWRGTKSVSLQVGFSEKMQEPQLWQTDKTLEIQQLGSDIFKQAALRGLARGKTMPFDHPTTYYIPVGQWLQLNFFVLVSHRWADPSLSFPGSQLSC